MKFKCLYEEVYLDSLVFFLFFFLNEPLVKFRSEGMLLKFRVQGGISVFKLNIKVPSEMKF